MYSISVKRFVSCLVTICVGSELFLILTDVFIGSNMIIFMPVESLQNIFNITDEHSLANFFSSIQMFFIGITLLFICFLLKTIKKKQSFIWFLYGMFFIYLAIDDGTAFHESIGDCTTFWIKMHGSFLLAKMLSFFPSYRWQITLGPFFLLAGLFMLYFLCYELKGLQIRRVLFIAVLCIINAELLDYLDGMEKPVLLIEHIFQLNNTVTLHLMRLVEEYLEMLSMTFLWYVFLTYLSHIIEGKTITFKKE